MSLAQSAVAATGTSSITVNKPSGGWLSGSTLLLTLTCQGTVTLPTTPSGWTLLQTNTAGNIAAGLYAITLSGAGPSSYTFTVPAVLSIAEVVEYTNTVTAGVDTSGKAASTGSAISFSNISATNASEIIVLFGCFQANAHSPTTPSGGSNTYAFELSQTAASPNGSQAWIWDATQTLSGAIGTVTCTDADASHWITFSASLLPAAGGSFTGSIAETMSLSDAVSAVMAAAGSLSETMSLSDSPSETLAAAWTLTESLNLVDAVSGVMGALGAIAETINLSDSVNGLPPGDYSGSVTESLSLSDAISAVLLGLGQQLAVTIISM